MLLSAAIAAFAFCLAGFSALAEGKASRLPDLPDPPTDPDLIKALEERKASGRQLINLQLTTMHAPKISAATGPLANVIRNEVAVPRLLIEIAIMRSAYVAGSEYELLQHQVLSKGCKYSQEKIDGIAQWHTSKAYDEKERALLAYTRAVQRSPLSPIWHTI